MNYLTKNSGNQIWNNRIGLATNHINNNIRKVYFAFGDYPNLSRKLKDAYPHSCILKNLWELINNTEIDIDYLTSFEHVNFTYIDLQTLHQYNGKKDYVNNHINEYKDRLKSFLNSYIFTLNDLKMLTRKSGIREINLCGNFELNEDKLRFNNKKDWLTMDGYEIQYLKSSCYWRAYPYSESPVCPSMRDFHSRVNDVNIILFSEDNWIQAMIYVKIEQNNEQEDQLYKYLANMRNFLKTDNTKNHYWDQRSNEHQKLKNLGLHIWVLNYNDIIEKLQTIQNDFDIRLTERKQMDYTEADSLYFDMYNKHKKIGRINLNTTFVSDEYVPEKQENEQHQYYLNELIYNDDFLDQIHLLQSIPQSMYNFLESKQFKDLYYMKYGTYVNPFQIEIRNRFYKELSDEHKQLLKEKYTLSEIDYYRLKYDNVMFKKYEQNLICPNHTPSMPLYYRLLSEEELNDLDCVQLEYNHDEYESLVIHGRADKYEFNYDNSIETYEKIKVKNKNTKIICSDAYELLEDSMKKEYEKIIYDEKVIYKRK